MYAQTSSHREEEGLVGLISEFPVDFHGKGKIALSTQEL